jgi:hypothetical protein
MQGAPDVQGAAAVALAHCYTCPALVVPLFTLSLLLKRASSAGRQLQASFLMPPSVLYTCLNRPEADV